MNAHLQTVDNDDNVSESLLIANNQAELLEIIYNLYHRPDSFRLLSINFTELEVTTRD